MSANRNTENTGNPGDSKNITGDNSQAQGQKISDPDLDRIKQKFSQIPRVIIVLSGKGGVGKSTVASQLAYTLVQNCRKSVGLLDFDICGPSIPRMAKVMGKPVQPCDNGWAPVISDGLQIMSVGLLLQSEDDAVIWRGPRKNSIIKQLLAEVEWKNLDYLIIDTPPGTSDEHISIIQYLGNVTDLCGILVTTPQEISMMDVRKEINFCKKCGLKILGLIENMSVFEAPVQSLKFVDFFGGDITDDVMENIKQKCPELLEYRISVDVFTKYGDGPDGLAKKFDFPLLGKIPIDTKLLEACEEGQCYTMIDPEPVGAKSFIKICHEIITRLESNL